MRSVVYAFTSFILSSSLVVVAGCGAPQEAVGHAQQAAGPNLGKADGAAVDRADRSCQLILRQVNRIFTGDGFETSCGDQGCNWVWTGRIEVAEELSTATVSVLYHKKGAASWWLVAATPVSGANPGFRAYEFRMSEQLFGPEVDVDSADAPKIELMPVVALADGGRLFDHNRRPQDFDNYELSAPGFSLNDDGCCRAEAGSLFFAGDWMVHQTGLLRQDGYLSITYDLNRLPGCRGTHNGHPAWDTLAQGRFLPGGQPLEGSVREFETSSGVPTNNARSKAFVVRIPKDATRVELWFRNYSGAGNSCESWDSAYGANYSFTIGPPADDARCKNVERWTRINSDMPYRNEPACLSEGVSRHANADQCELYVDGVGDGYMGHYGIPNRWVESYLKVPAGGDPVLAVGQLTIYRDTATGQRSTRYTLARQLNAETWQSGFIFLRSSVGGVTGFTYEVEQLAFFVDRKRPSGEVVRLWQSRHGANYGWGELFNPQPSTVYIPYGNIRYASTDSGMLETRRSCSQR